MSGSTIKSWFTRKFAPPRHVTSEDVTKVFQDLFVGHGIACSLDNNEIRDNAGRFAARCFVTETSRFDHSVQLRLDMIIRFDTGDEVFESCVGIGQNWNEATNSAIKYFCDGVFHVIYSAVSRIPCSHCQIVKWEISGISRQVYLGPMTTRGNLDLQNPAFCDWFLIMEKIIKELDLKPGRHWIRLFHAEMQDQTSVSECLLDNQPASALQSLLHSLEWPKTGSYYSVRVFLMIDDDIDSMSIQST